MNKIEFINGIKLISNQSVESIIQSLIKPPGRKPSLQDISMSTFYNSLDEKSQSCVKNIIIEAANQSLFSLLCVLDHVGFIEDSEEKTRFELYAIKNNQKELINELEGEYLHDLFK